MNDQTQFERMYFRVLDQLKEKGVGTDKAADVAVSVVSAFYERCLPAVRSAGTLGFELKGNGQ